MLSFLDIKKKILKLKFYYTKNQGEYMNNYKQKLIVKGKDDSYDKMKEIIMRLKEIFFGDALYKFSNFELIEINRIKELLVNLSHNLLNHDSEFVHMSVYDQKLLSLILCKEDFDNFLHTKCDLEKENQTLNFKLKSLNFEKRELINKFNLSGLVKIGDKITDIKDKLKNQTDKIIDFENNINNIINEFFDKYLSMLNDISDSVMTTNAKVKSIKNADGKILSYYKINKFIFYINSIKNEIVFDSFVEILKDDKDFLSFFEPDFAYVVNEVIYVGTNI